MLVEVIDWINQSINLQVFKTPEVSRVYIGTWWDEPLHYDDNRKLFDAEKSDLFEDLQHLPRNAALRKLNDLIKRARLAKVGGDWLIDWLIKYSGPRLRDRRTPQTNANNDGQGEEEEGAHREPR